MIYKEDLENSIYLKIISYFKELKEVNREIKKAEKIFFKIK